MTKTLEVVEAHDEEPLGPAPEVLDEKTLLETGLSPDEVAMVAGLVRKAGDQGLALTGPGGLLKVVDQDGPGDLTGRQPLGEQADHQLVQISQPALPLADDPGLEAALTIPGDRDLHLPAGVGDDRLRPVAVAGVAQVPALNWASTRVGEDGSEPGLRQ